MRTLTGLSMQDAYKALKSRFPQRAITRRPGAGDLSAIDAYYRTERLNEVFGLCGLGWRYSFLDIKVHDDSVVVCVQFFFVVILDDGAQRECGPILSWGSGQFRKGWPIGDAYKSATTDAVTKAASMIGVGHDVFMGIQTHESVDLEIQISDAEWLVLLKDWWTSIPKAIFDAGMARVGIQDAAVLKTAPPDIRREFIAYIQERS